VPDVPLLVTGQQGSPSPACRQLFRAPNACAESSREASTKLGHGTKLGRTLCYRKRTSWLASRPNPLRLAHRRWETRRIQHVECVCVTCFSYVQPRRIQHVGAVCVTCSSSLQARRIQHVGGACVTCFSSIQDRRIQNVEAVCVTCSSSVQTRRIQHVGCVCDMFLFCAGKGVCFHRGRSLFYWLVGEGQLVVFNM